MSVLTVKTDVITNIAEFGNTSCDTSGNVGHDFQIGCYWF